MKPSVTAVTVFLLALTGSQALGQEVPLYNPYERPKNGPPLTDVFNKLEPGWLFTKLRDPQHHVAARMPDFRFSEAEVLDLMAYLKSLAAPSAATSEWPAWAGKSFEELDDEEFDAVLEAADAGRIVWSTARCTICHTVNGPGGGLIGGFVDLRVGGIDLQISADRLRRDWLYEWIKEPKNYFPDTLMPRFRPDDQELRALVEYILRDDAFLSPAQGADPAMPENWRMLDDTERIGRGERLVELSRCVLCHDISGVEELLSWPERPLPPGPGTFEFLAWDLRCLSCHTIEGRGGTYAPDLTGVGSRLHEAWVARFVEAPDMIRPLSQQMPKFDLTPDEASTIASYLGASRRDEGIPAEIPGGPATAADIERGGEIFQAKGCFSCHTVGEGPGGVVGPSLDVAGDRLRPGYIWYHLNDPHALNPLSAEPDFGLSEDEARALAAYLASKGR